MSTFIFSQTEGLKLRNLDNGEIKILKAEDGDEFRFKYENDENTTLSIRGEKPQIEGREIVLDVQSKVFKTNENNDIYTENSVVFCGGREKRYSLKNLQSIEYYSAEANNRRKVGVLLMAAGAMTTFIVAPIVSLDYDGSDFNQSRYTTYAAAGLGGIILGFPIIGSSREKTFNISENGDNKWEIVK